MVYTLIISIKIYIQLIRGLSFELLVNNLCESAMLIKRHIIQVSLLSFGLLLSTFEPLYANPSQSNVVAGNAAINNQGSLTTINQSTDKAIINWQTFNIAQGETTQFIQPSAASVTLNRVMSNDPSSILGTLKANGQIMLINQNGILFGANSQVDVASLIATTANISDNNFLSNNYHFVQNPNNNVGIVNNGLIKVADAGLVALVAPGVQNSGVIQANLGKVVLASGKEFTLVDTYGDGLINLTAGITQTPVTISGEAMHAAVSNPGIITADGGKVLLTAKAANNLVEQVINMKGVIQANSVTQRNGEIILSGGDTGIVQVNGKINAKGDNHKQGGKVKILGEKIGLFTGTEINTSGDIGGGEILIGGDYHGDNPTIQNASAVYIDKAVAINADALTKGNGGKIIIWSDDVTRVYGNLSARGGTQGGNGGLIETSSKAYLDVADIQIDTRSSLGNIGQWLLDPTDLTICSSCTTSPGFGSDIFSPSNGSSSLKILDLVNQLANTNITIETTGAGIGGNGDISITDPIDWNSGHSLTLNAYNNLNINAAITGNGSIFNLTSSKGDVNINANIIMAGTNLNITGGHNFSLNNNQTINLGNGTASINANNNLTVNGSITNNNVMSLKADADGNGIGDLTFYNTANVVSNNNPMTWQGAHLFIQNGDTFHFDSGTGLFTLKATNAGSANQPSLGLGNGANGYMQISSAFLNNILFNSGVSFEAVNGINTQNLHLQVVNPIADTEFPITFDAGKGKLNFVNSFINTANNQLTLKGSDLNIDSHTTLNSGTADTNIQSTSSIGLGVIGANAATGKMNVTNEELSTITAANLRVFAGPNSDIQISSMQQPNLISNGVYLTAYSGSINFNGGSNATPSQFNSVIAQSGHSININNNINTSHEISMIANAASDLNSNFQPNGGALILQSGIHLNANDSIFLETDGIPNDAITSPAGDLTINGILKANNVVLQGNNSVIINGLINADNAINIWANHDGDRSLYFTMGNSAKITTGGDGNSGQVLIKVNNTQPSGNGSLGVPYGYATLGNINTQTLTVDTTAGGTATTGAYINQTTGTHLNIKGASHFITGSGSNNRSAYIQLDQAGNYFSDPISLTTGASSNGSNFANVIYNNNNTLQLGNSNVNGGDLTVISRNSGIALLGTQNSNQNITLAAAAPSVNAPNNDPYKTYSFYNNVGANALVTPKGRWIVYSATPDADYFNQLNSNNLAYWGQNYGSASNAYIPKSGNYYAFNFTPYLDVKTNNINKIYGDVNANNLNFLSYTVGANFGYPITSDTASAFKDNANQLNALYAGTADLKLLNNPLKLNVGDYEIVSSQGSLTSATGYRFNFKNGNLTINPRSITITANSDQSKVYGNVDPTFSYTVAQGNLVNNDQFTGALGRTIGENVGDYAFNLGNLTINTPGFQGNNYIINLNSNYAKTFSITPAPLVISANNATRTLGQASPLFTVNYNGLVNGDDASVVNNLFISTNANASSPAGTYSITPSQAWASNYAITFKSGELTIRPIYQGQLPNTAEVYAKNNSLFEVNKNINLCINIIGYEDDNKSYLFDINKKYYCSCQNDSQNTSIYTNKNLTKLNCTRSDLI